MRVARAQTIAWTGFMAAFLVRFAGQNDPGRGVRQPSIASSREQAHAGVRSRSGSGAMRVRAVLLAAALAVGAAPTIPAARATSTPPYSRSRVVAGITWDT